MVQEVEEEEEEEGEEEEEKQEEEEEEEEDEKEKEEGSFSTTISDPKRHGSAEPWIHNQVPNMAARAMAGKVRHPHDS